MDELAVLTRLRVDGVSGERNHDKLRHFLAQAERFHPAIDALLRGAVAGGRSGRGRHGKEQEQGKNSGGDQGVAAGNSLATQRCEPSLLGNCVRNPRASKAAGGSADAAPSGSKIPLRPRFWKARGLRRSIARSGPEAPRIRREE